MDDKPFDEVGDLFPGETRVESVSGDTRVVDALAIMLEKRYSQVPVMDSGVVRGVFSLRSLGQQVAIAPALKIESLLVEDVMEELPFVTVKDSLHYTLGMLDRHEALLVNSPHGLQAIVTAFDVLRHFYRVARPFILMREIELALRSLIALCAPGEKLKECISQAVAKNYERKGLPVPTELHRLAFGDYRSIIISSKNWSLFEGVMGQDRELVSTRLEQTRKIRNDAFHFRRAISRLDHQTLVTVRHWLLDKTRRAETTQQEGEHVE